jgi:hypothetical protein
MLTCEVQFVPHHPGFPRIDPLSVPFMTAARQEMKATRLFWALPIASFAAIARVLAVLSLTSSGPAGATTTERVVSDPKTGLAISGFDPVGYFTDARPILGVPAMESSYEGAIWRFQNEGNRAAFVAHPKVYAPRFGGYDPVDLARGKTVETHPSLWLIVDQRLYLFATEANRAAFAVDSGSFVDSAERRWPELRESLAQ